MLSCHNSLCTVNTLLKSFLVMHKMLGLSKYFSYLQQPDLIVHSVVIIDFVYAIITAVCYEYTEDLTCQITV